MEYASNTYDLYHDIQQRTGGEIYIGVLGPVRTGKSTFIKRFMEEMVLPYMEDEHAKVRAQDELPQSAGGKTITTTEPKFIPNEAANVTLSGDIAVSVRLIDCVGYMVEGAPGHMEEDVERMVKTPWFDYEIPFTQAAELGTDKVMNDHSTIGLVVTTDGSFGEIPRENYLEAEEKTILALKKLRKPFLVLVNSQKPYSEDAKRVAGEIGEKYGVSAVTVNCEQLKKEDINMLLENVLYEFPISSIEFYMPKWVEMLPGDNRMKMDIIERVKALMKDYAAIRDVLKHPVELTGDYIKRCKTDTVSLSDGVIRNKLIAAKTRSGIVLSHILTSCIACTCVYAVTTFFSLGVGSVFFENDVTAGAFIRFFLLGIGMSAATGCLFSVAALVCGDKTSAVIWCLGIACFMLFLCLHTNGLLVQTEYKDGALNPHYVGGFRRALYGVLHDLNPYGQAA